MLNNCICEKKGTSLLLDLLPKKICHCSDYLDPSMKINGGNEKNDPDSEYENSLFMEAKERFEMDVRSFYRIVFQFIDRYATKEEMSTATKEPETIENTVKFVERSESLTGKEKAFYSLLLKKSPGFRSLLHRLVSSSPRHLRDDLVFFLLYFWEVALIFNEAKEEALQGEVNSKA